MKRSVVLPATFFIETFVVRLVGQFATDQKPPTFEVASVKPNTSGDTNGVLQLPGGRMTAANMPVRQMITFAYQVAGLLNPMQVALQRLLEDRFKLKVLRETREMDIYALVMAKPGSGPGPNRLMLAEAPAQELMVYDFLARCYKAQLLRNHHCDV
jgi:hypothetical protein